MNLIKMAIDQGFTADIKHFHHLNGWFGVTTNHPDAVLSLGNKSIYLSLGGIDAGLDRDCCADQFLTKDSNGVYKLTAKRIALYKDDQLFYKSCGGEMPDEQTIINFFKS